MPQASDDSSTFSPARMLKGAALAFVLLGGTMAVWGLDKWIRYPEARASQFGFQAPLWPAFVGFTILGTAVAVGLLWTTARRVEAGEDLFAQRQRRRPDREKHSDSDLRR